MAKVFSAIICIVTSVIAGCNNPGSEAVLLQTGAYTLSPADYEFAGSNAQYRSMTARQLEDRLVEEGRILAFAMDHRYDTISLLQRQLEYAMRYYASSVDGYVWNREVKPLLKVTADEIREAYARRSTEYLLEFIRFSNEEQLKRYFASTPLVNTAKEFHALRRKTKADPVIQYYSVFHRYPFYPSGVYSGKMARPRAGDAWGPFETPSGYYVMHVAEERKVTQRPFEQEQGLIREELLNALREKYILESQRQILQETRPHIHREALAGIAAKVNTMERKWPGVDSGLVLMEYHFRGKQHHYTAADFMEFVQCQPMFTGSLSEPQDIKKMLHAYLISISLFARAQQLGIEQDTAYQQFRKRYQQGIFITHYKRQHIYPNISIREGEMESYYRGHSSDFTCFATATILVSRYPDIQSAFEGRRLLMEKPPTEAGRVEVRVKDTTCSEAVIAAVSKLEPGAVSVPVPENGYYWIISLVSKSGVMPMPYKYARKSIRELLFSQKEKTLIAELETEYPVKVNHIAAYLAKSK
ncbi:peptidylprolyl isomerase [Chitinophaga sp. XS-30]|uniref:peptidylprolyl isomerase n=1 Tax=Chitinophaga sp. XS-30 TaxID=2604421 RepID=UPI0011DD76B5|nr:peptidylprolyl isomerase [Chitinophaga sp. XS-30]QEH42339.1 peptidyl-prolyl cis-trans isomerase [Chitinophaga sp. XS-30]